MAFHGFGSLVLDGLRLGSSLQANKNSIKPSEEGIIANIDSLTSVALETALFNRRLKSKTCLSALRRTARRYNTWYIRRLQLEGDGTQDVSTLRDRYSDSILSTQETAGTFASYLPLWKPTNVNLAPWNKQYNENTNVREFIKRVDELSIKTNTSHEIISRCFIDVIAGDVLLWFRSLKDENLSWLELKKLLIQKFEPPKAQYTLKTQIYTRRQTPGEAASDFFSEIRRNNSFLESPVPEEELLPIFKYGLLPNYASLLASQVISSAEQLKNLCENFERIQNFAPSTISTATSRNGIADILKPRSLCYDCTTRHYLYDQSAYNINRQKNGSKLPQEQIRSCEINAGEDISVPPPMIVKTENELVPARAQ